MAILPYPPAEQVREMLHQSPFSEDTPPGNVFRMLAQAPPVGSAALGLIYAVLSATGLDPRVREIVILRVAWRSESQYAFAQHAAIAGSVGVADAQISSLREGAASHELFNETDLAAVTFADAVLDRADVSAATWARLAEHFPPDRIVELLLTIGCFRMMCRLVTVLELELEPAFGVEALQLARERGLLPARSAFPTTAHASHLHAA
jgi:4-carboxymuconolactone decarboxylase